MSADVDAPPAASVVHIRLDGGAPPPAPPSGEALVYVWRGETPVGVAWSQPGAEIDFSRPLDLADPEALKRADAGFAPPPPGAVSLVICTLNRPDELRRCLASLPEQSRPPDEIIVVDNGSSDDRTRQVALAAGVRYVREDRPGLSAARNAGVRAASGEFVAFTDDDVILHPLWLERLIAAFTGPEVQAVTGLVIPAELRTASQVMFEREWSFGRGLLPIDFDAAFFAKDLGPGCPVWEIGAGASMAFRRSVFASAGLFEERLGPGAAGGCADDSEMWYRILAEGGVCRYEPASVAFHYHRNTLEGLEKQLRDYMKGHTAALFLQYDRTGNRSNLRRAFKDLPKWYATLAVRRWLMGRRDHPMLLSEIRGFLSGLAYGQKPSFRRGAPPRFADAPAPAARRPEPAPAPRP